LLAVLGSVFRGRPIAQYTRSFAECERKDIQPAKDGFDCRPENQLILADGRSVEMGQVLGDGWAGFTYSSENFDDVIIKIGKDADANLCNEIAALKALKNVEGVPKIYGIKSGVKVECRSRTVVMSKAGNADWDQVK
jgi:hypothetical protein